MIHRREALSIAFTAIRTYESRLVAQLVDGLQAINGIKIYGITNREQFDQRLSTLSFTHTHLKPREIAHQLGEHGIFVWHGNYYAQPLTEALGLEPEGMVRVGLVHYNTAEEVDRLLETLREIVR